MSFHGDSGNLVDLIGSGLALEPTIWDDTNAHNLQLACRFPATTLSLAIWTSYVLCPGVPRVPPTR